MAFPSITAGCPKHTRSRNDRSGRHYCRSLHDSLANENSSTSERRVQIDLASIREALQEVHATFSE
eukprot:3814689-Amphidinium_carterae.1